MGSSLYRILAILLLTAHYDSSNIAPPHLYRNALWKWLVTICNHYGDDRSVPYASEYTPPLSIRRYLKRIERSLRVEDRRFVLIWILMDRVSANRFNITHWNVHRLIAASTWISLEIHQRRPKHKRVQIADSVFCFPDYAGTISNCT